MAEDGADIDQHIPRVVDSLAERFTDKYASQTIEQAVAEARAQLEADAHVTKYPPGPRLQKSDRQARRAKLERCCPGDNLTCWATCRSRPDWDAAGAW